MTDNAKMKASKKLRRFIVNLWEISSPTADRLYSIFNAVLVIGTVLGLCGTVGTIILSGIREEFSNKSITDAQQRADQAKKLAGPRNIVGADKEYLKAQLEKYRGISYDLTLPPLQYNPFPTFVEQGSQLPEHLIVILTNLCGWELRSVEGSVKKVALPTQQRLLVDRSLWEHPGQEIFIPNIYVGEITGVNGVKIVLPPKGRLQDAAIDLWQALDHIGIVASLEYPPPNNNLPTGTISGDRIHIIVGTKI